MAEVLAGPSGLTRQHLPVPSANDIGKYLKIDANGNPVYYTETPGGTVTEAGANAANDVGAATGATTALKLANLTANASETQEGVAELATAAEIVTGTDTGRVPNVANLKTGIAGMVAGASNKATLADADKTLIADSADTNSTKHATMANLLTYMRIATSGTPTAGYFPKFSTVGGSVGIATQNISFPATQAASTDPNALDDYEEINLTPAFVCGSGSITCSDAVGKARKIGDTVFFRIGLVVQSVSSPSGTLKISGLFYTRDNVTYLGAPCHVRMGAVALVNMTGYMLSATVDQNATTLTISKVKDGALDSASVADIIDKVSQIITIEGFYQVA